MMVVWELHHIQWYTGLLAIQGSVLAQRNQEMLLMRKEKDCGIAEKEMRRDPCQLLTWIVVIMVFLDFVVCKNYCVLVMVFFEMCVPLVDVKLLRQVLSCLK